MKPNYAYPPEDGRKNMWRRWGYYALALVFLPPIIEHTIYWWKILAWTIWP